MTEVFKSYTPIVQKLLEAEGDKLSPYIVDENIEEFLEEHDNWDGGQDYYMLSIGIPVEMFSTLKKNALLTQYEEKIKNYYENLLRDTNCLFLNKVVLRPCLDGTVAFDHVVKDSMWKVGFFRLFISHLTANKKEATGLKRSLTKYGIDCFVAHEDIKPSNKWEIEIENALYSMDALCAIVVPDIKNSEWCDQEIGYAFGQKKMAFSILKGATPYGFLARFQGVSSLNKNYGQIAHDVWYAITHNEKTRDVYLNKLIDMLLNTRSEESALGYLHLLADIDILNKEKLANFHSHYNENEILMKKPCLDFANKLFSIFGLPDKHIVHSEICQELLSDDLPF